MYAQNDLLKNSIPEFVPEISLNFNPRVQAFVEYFTIRDRAYSRNILKIKEVYFPLFEKKLKEYGLPDELKYLSIIESALNPNAISRAGAAGLWQFMPYTGKSYGLHQDWYVDERMDPEASTDAACKYLKQLFGMFDDWELAIAAYNAGPGNVRKAIRRSGYKKKFWEIYKHLPRETRSYLPQFVAMIYTIKYADQHNLTVIDEEFLPLYDTIIISQYFHLETFCNQLNLCYDDIAKLNPHIKRGALPAKIRNFPLKIPVDLKEEVIRNRVALYDTASKVGKKKLEYLARNTPGSTYGRQKIVYRVRSGDVLGKIALRHHVRVSDLRRWNRIRGNLIRVGQRLSIWVLPAYNSKTKKLYSASGGKKRKKDGKKKPLTASITGEFYHVKPGDTLWDISKLYNGISISKIKELNNLTNNRIKPGQKLLIGTN